VNFFERITSRFGDVPGDEAYDTGMHQYFVGTALRDRREEFALDLDSVGEALCIKPSYLAAIEQSRPQDLPGPAYALGFVRAYAQYLGFDPDEVLNHYKTESAAVQARPDLALPVPLGARSVPGGALLLVGAILALCGYGTWYYLSTGERSRPERVEAVPTELQQTLRGAPPVPVTTPPESTATGGTGAQPAGDKPQRTAGGLVPGPAFALNAGPPTASAPSSSSPSAPRPASGTGAAAAAPGATPPVSAASGAAGASTMTASAAPPPLPAAADRSPDSIAPPGATPASTGDATKGDAAKGGSAGRVEIRATADCWIQVRSADDQSIVFSRVLKAGETYKVPRAGLFLRTGNAGALSINVDGKPTPPIGGVGTLRRDVLLDPDPLLAGKAVKG